jgi:hypothetical protein
MEEEQECRELKKFIDFECCEFCHEFYKYRAPFKVAYKGRGYYTCCGGLMQIHLEEDKTTLTKGEN